MNMNRILELVEQNVASKSVRFAMSSGAISNNGGSTWVTNIDLGEPAQKLKMMLDTGTLNTWVTSSTCTTQACFAHKSYSPSNSKTYEGSHRAPKVECFGPWGEMGVIFGFDYGQFSMNNSDDTVKESLSMMLATSYTGSSFENLVGDGGLAIPAIVDNEATAILNDLFNNGVIDYPIASFYLDKATKTGECLLGGINADHFIPETLNCLPLLAPYGGNELAYLWAVKLDSLCVNSESVYAESCETQLVLDTGASFFKGAKQVIDPLINAVTCNGKHPKKVDSFSELKNYPPIFITLGNDTYELTPEQYFVKIGASWEIAIQVLKGMPENMLLVGQVFLETVYSIFNFGNNNLNERCLMLAKPKKAQLNVEGQWVNEFESKLVINSIRSNGTFEGTYSSTTGASGIYPVMGVADPNPLATQAVSFSVTWHSETGEPNPTWHDVSGFTGVLQIDKDGSEELIVTFILQKEITSDTPSYEAASISSLRFTRL